MLFLIKDSFLTLFKIVQPALWTNILVYYSYFYIASPFCVVRVAFLLKFAVIKMISQHFSILNSIFSSPFFRFSACGHRHAW